METLTSTIPRSSSPADLNPEGPKVSADNAVDNKEAVESGDEGHKRQQSPSSVAALIVETFAFPTYIPTYTTSANSNISTYFPTWTNEVDVNRRAVGPVQPMRRHTIVRNCCNLDTRQWVRKNLVLTANANCVLSQAEIFEQYYNDRQMLLPHMRSNSNELNIAILAVFPGVGLQRRGRRGSGAWVYHGLQWATGSQ